MCRTSKNPDVSYLKDVNVHACVHACVCWYVYVKAGVSECVHLDVDAYLYPYLCV